MQYDFLTQFPQRMKTVGRYAALFCNSSQKGIWKDTQFSSPAQQLNLIFAVLLYIMEQSLKEERCTVDDIAAFVDTVNAQYFRKPLSFQDCLRLSDFIVNEVLSNCGVPMSFDGFDFDEQAFTPIPISFIANRIVYVEGELRRTSYYLTDDGYSLMLGTLEMESNLKLTIQEMVFQLHLEKQSYDKALDDIKSVFNLMRIQLQKLQEAMRHIRRNALDYSVNDYDRLMREDLETIDSTKTKFQAYRETVQQRAAELVEAGVLTEKLDKSADEKLDHLRQIDGYLSRAIDEYQKILSSHFDLKSLYSEELEKITELSAVQRFSFRQSLFEPLLSDSSALERLDLFLRPLFRRDMEKSYHLGMAFTPQTLRTINEEVSTSEMLDFDEAGWREEQEAARRQKNALYKGCLYELLAAVSEKKSITLSEMKLCCLNAPDIQQRFIPSLDIFKEVMVELLSINEIDINALRTERANFLQDESEQFQLNRMLLDLIEENSQWNGIRRLWSKRLPEKPLVTFHRIPSDSGIKTVNCTDFRFSIDG